LINRCVDLVEVNLIIFVVLIPILLFRLVSNHNFLERLRFLHDPSMGGRSNHFVLLKD
jgi:hypothetical protein